MDFYPDDFLVGTSRLSVDEKGAYWVICSLIYSVGGPVPDDDRWLALMCGTSLRHWKTLKSSLLAVGKIELIDGSLLNKRSLTELDRAMKRTLSAQVNGKLGGHPRADEPQLGGKLPENSPPEFNKDNEIAKPPGSDDQKAINHQPTTISHQKNIGDFELWWAEYPLKKSKGQALKAFCSALKKPGVTLSILIEGARRYRRETRETEPKFIKHPSTWLNGECWADEAPRAAQKPGNLAIGTPEHKKWLADNGLAGDPT